MNHLRIESYKKEKRDKNNQGYHLRRNHQLIYLSTIIGDETANYEEDDEILESVLAILQHYFSVCGDTRMRRF